ncbi:hypothetical protein QJS04_geneDACA024595 [Acorus gramineus]|uniref:Uncharacterized protein n=1 Tax=Acorus gramineus TaxID=55184 RepID=A0AAV9A385_ACOGR|nr:hypothetical protein QJS04_geneDACA024595 [Acorus gramineus]
MFHCLTPKLPALSCLAKMSYSLRSPYYGFVTLTTDRLSDVGWARRLPSPSQSRIALTTTKESLTVYLSCFVTHFSLSISTSFCSSRFIRHYAQG